MFTYEEIIASLSEYKDEKFRVFIERIVNIKSGSSIGVRTPQLRKYAKKLVGQSDFSFETLFSFPNYLYEIRLLKCLCVGYARLPFEEWLSEVEKCLPVLDGWAVCDLFCSTLKRVKKYRKEFLPLIEKCIADGREFYQRFGYVMLLGCYMEKEYLPFIFEKLEIADVSKYYVHMGAAWLIAEVLVKYYEDGVNYLKICPLGKETVNKAIQKARESYRLNETQKNYLKLLKK